jgi:hypothetical protein
MAPVVHSTTSNRLREIADGIHPIHTNATRGKRPIEAPKPTPAAWEKS